MHRQRLTLMILDINIKYKVLPTQFFLVLGVLLCSRRPSVCLVCPVGNPVPERGEQGLPTPAPPTPAPAREITAGSSTGPLAKAQLEGPSLYPWV